MWAATAVSLIDNFLLIVLVCTKFWTKNLLGSCVGLISADMCVLSVEAGASEHAVDLAGLGRFEMVPGLFHFQILARTMVLYFQRLRNVFNY